MKVLIAYSSRYGATQGIAERIAATLRQQGLEAAAQPAEDADDPAGISADTGDLNERIRPHNVAIECVLSGEQLLCDALTDDDYHFGFLPIGLCEVTPL